ncbi:MULTISPECIES: hypothetical protein [unclassified Modestobacter]
MTMFAEPPTLTSSRPADGETDLATLLELFTVSAAAETSRVESLRDAGAWLRGLVRRWSRRAADWGAAPGTAAAWATRPVPAPVEAAQ